MGTPFYPLQSLIQRLRTQLPLSVILTDPFTKQSLEVKRENVLQEFIVDTANLGMESQMVPALYVEFARLERAAEYSADVAAAKYTQWKSERASEFRAFAPDAPAPASKARGKKADDGEPKPVKVTNAQAEEYYRSHEDYLSVRDEEMRLRALQGLFAACREGMQMKSRMIDSQHRSVRGYEGVERMVYGAEEAAANVGYAQTIPAPGQQSLPHMPQSAPVNGAPMPGAPLPPPSQFNLPAFTPPTVGGPLPPMPSMPR